MTSTPALTWRRVPWPYRAMLALCSDLDETPQARTYLEIARFLNTTEPTAMGAGVGLEVGNTIYFDMPAGQFSYWNTDDRGREALRTLIGTGHIDAIHSWGDLACRRAHAERNLAELERHGCRLEVWIDHSKSPSNFGPDIMRGSGDQPGAPAYHADLTLAYGVRYVWRGRTTGLTAQDAAVAPGSFAPILTSRHPVVSVRSAVKEAVKVALGRAGHPRWAMYGSNRVCRPCRLRDGRPAWEFLRTNPSWGGPGASDTAAGLAEVLTPRMLDRLVDRQGVAVVYTHLGKVRDPDRPFGAATVDALRRLARLREDGVLFVTTTRRLLRYLTVRDHICHRTVVVGDRLVVTLDAVDDPVSGRRTPADGDLDGLSFRVASTLPVEVRRADGSRLPVRSVREGEGAQWICNPWPALCFPRMASGSPN